LSLAACHISAHSNRWYYLIPTYTVVSDSALQFQQLSMTYLASKDRIGLVPTYTTRTNSTIPADNIIMT